MKAMRMSERGLPFLNILLYGKPGCGKTAAALTTAMPAGLQVDAERGGMHDVAVANVEGGMLTAMDMKLQADPIMVDIRSPQDMEELAHQIADKTGPFEKTRTVVVDSLTEVVAKDLESTTRKNLPKTSRSGKRREGVDDIWLEDRGEVSARTARIARWYRDLDVHFIATAHPREVFPPTPDGAPNMSAAPVKVEPGFGPRLNQHLCGYFDFVWYMERHPSGEYVRVVTQPTGAIFAKTRGATNQELFGAMFDWPLGAPLLPDVLRALLTREWTYAVNKKETKK